MLFHQMNKQQLEALHSKLSEKYNEFKSRNLNLDMSRGKPSPEQLDLSLDMLGCVNENSGYKSECGFDCRNYGVLDGIKTPIFVLEENS